MTDTGIYILPTKGTEIPAVVLFDLLFKTYDGDEVAVTRVPPSVIHMAFKQREWGLSSIGEGEDTQELKKVKGVVALSDDRIAVAIDIVDIIVFRSDGQILKRFNIAQWEGKAGNSGNYSCSMSAMPYFNGFAMTLIPEKAVVVVDCEAEKVVHKVTDGIRLPNGCAARRFDLMECEMGTKSLRFFKFDEESQTYFLAVENTDCKMECIECAYLNDEHAIVVSYEGAKAAIFATATAGFICTISVDPIQRSHAFTTIDTSRGGVMVMNSRDHKVNFWLIRVNIAEGEAELERLQSLPAASSHGARRCSYEPSSKYVVLAREDHIGCVLNLECL